MRAYKVTRGQHYDAGTTMAVSEPYSFYILFPAKLIMTYTKRPRGPRV